MAFGVADPITKIDYPPQQSRVHARLSEVIVLYDGLQYRVPPRHSSRIIEPNVKGKAATLLFSAFTSTIHITLKVDEYDSEETAVKATTSSQLRSAPGFIPAKGFNGEMIGDECYHDGSYTSPNSAAHLRIRAGRRVIDYRIYTGHRHGVPDRLLQKADLDLMTSNAKKMVEILSKIPLKAAIK